MPETVSDLRTIPDKEYTMNQDNHITTDTEAPTASTVIKTVKNESVLCKSSDVGVQATPASVTADLHTPGILPVTSAMINSSNSLQQPAASDQQDLTNTKEKTPMCLVNELARYNKVPHKYVLVDEKGPAHKKEFHIRLDLGGESYQAAGTSIKRAQHAAAETALQSTKLKRPSQRTLKPETLSTLPAKKTVPITPTVELNALAMKLGVQTEYVNTDPPRLPAQYSAFMYTAHLTDPYHRMSPYHPGFYPHIRGRVARPSYSVLLHIGKHEFKGEGTTRQQARHNAASKALIVLKASPLQRTSPTPQSSSSSASKSDQSTESQSLPDAANVDGAVPASNGGANVIQSEVDNSNKSEISLVHEIALRNKKTVSFEVIHESGPPHMRTFITRCQCGDLSTEGEGNSKRSSKKKAAELMLDELQIDGDPVAVQKNKVKNIANKKKNRNLIKMQKANIDYGCGINPISRLIQIQQANKKKEPVYTLVKEEGLPRKREFVMQVVCNDLKCLGKGPNKKLAKRNAAEEMLQLMGYSKPSPTPGKSALKSPDSVNSNSSNHASKHVTFFDTSNQAAKVPGIIVRQESQPKSNTETPLFKPDIAASIAKELLETGKSATGESILPTKEHPEEPLKTYKEQLQYLGECMGFAVEYTDFPKGSNTNQCLALVALRVNPARVFHSNAPTIEESHDKASLRALKDLAQPPPLPDEADDKSISEASAKEDVNNEAKDHKSAAIIIRSNNTPSNG